MYIIFYISTFYNFYLKHVWFGGYLIKQIFYDSTKSGNTDWPDLMLQFLFRLCKSFHKVATKQATKNKREHETPSTTHVHQRDTCNNSRKAAVSPTRF
jgi:hypothetical protein